MGEGSSHSSRYGLSGLSESSFRLRSAEPERFRQRTHLRELQGDWIVQLLDHLRQRNWARFEATVPAEEAWRAQVIEIASGTLFPRADSWYLGANIPGKPREMLSFAGGLSTYMAKCNESAKRGYEGFTIS